jgi:hypothetical protein
MYSFLKCLWTRWYGAIIASCGLRLVWRSLKGRWNAYKMTPAMKEALKSTVGRDLVGH